MHLTSFNVMRLTKRREEEKPQFALNPLLGVNLDDEHLLLKVDAHLDDHHKEETDHSQHDDAQEDAELLCGIEPEESEDDDSVGNTGADPQPDLGTTDKLICTGNSQDCIETSCPAVCLKKCVSNADTGRHHPTDQGRVENCQAVLVPEKHSSIYGVGI